MTLSTGPWWCAPVFAFGWMTTVPAQSFSAPMRAWVMAAARFMPGVCAVLMSSWSEWTTRTPSNFHFGLSWSWLMRPLSGFAQAGFQQLERLAREGPHVGLARGAAGLEGDDGFAGAADGD